MRQGYEVTIQNASQEVEYVSDFLEELSSEEETRKLWRAWSGLLDHYSKSVAALRRATDQGPSKRWSDSLLNEQKNDPILQYAFQARAHATHVFETKRETSPRAVSIGNLVSISGNSSVTLSNNTVIESGRIHRLPDGTIYTKDGRYSGGTIPREAVQEQEHYVVLSDVTTRSGVWRVPNPKTVRSRQAIEIAEHVLNWLRQKLGEAEALAASEKDRK